MNEKNSLTIEQKYLYKTKPNNWLKRHGYSMRRRPNKRHYIILDEFHMIGQLPDEFLKTPRKVGKIKITQVHQSLKDLYK